MTSPTYAEIDPRACIGHVHLRVADLKRATVFYRDALGFAVRFYGPRSACRPSSWPPAATTITSP
jgi:catechol-2,3-dioxygenase